MPKSFIYVNNYLSVDYEGSQAGKTLKVKYALHVKRTFIRKYISLWTFQQETVITAPCVPMTTRHCSDQSS